MKFCIEEPQQRESRKKNEVEKIETVKHPSPTCEEGVVNEEGTNHGASQQNHLDEPHPKGSSEGREKRGLISVDIHCQHGL